MLGAKLLSFNSVLYIANVRCTKRIQGLAPFFDAYVLLFSKQQGPVFIVLRKVFLISKVQVGIVALE